MRAAVAVVIAVAAWNAAPATEPAVPIPAEARLPVILDETFLTHPLERAKTIGSGEFSWHMGRLVLMPEKARESKPMGVVYPVYAGPVAELTVDLLIPSSEGDGETAETRLGMTFEGRQILEMAVVRTRTGQETRAEVRLVQTADREQVLRVVPLAADISSGLWRLDYRHGWLQVEQQRRCIAQGFARTQPVAAAITGIAVTQRGGRAEVRRLQVAAAQAPALDDSRRQFLKDAIRLQEKATQSYSQGKHPEAVRTAIESCILFQKVHGREHPDVATAMLAAAVALEASGRLDEAIKSGEQAVLIQQRVLGGGHPLTAISRVALGRALRSRGKQAQALEQLQTALPVYESVFGAEDPKTAALRKLLHQ